MLYVIQTTTRDEELVIDLIKKEMNDNPSLISIFTPLKEELVKYRGSWHKVNKLLFPSYIFIETENIDDCYNHLYNIPRLTKLLGRDKKEKKVVPLFKEEEDYIFSLIGINKDHVVELSDIEILDNKEVKVLSGPLKGLSGKVIKTDLHKRRVTVLIPLLGQLVETSLGINIVEKIENNE